jgi:polyisoprenoid-binding protein YceI
MKKILFVCFLISLAIHTKAQNQQWEVSSSSIKFKIKNAGLTVDGTFSGLEAHIVFDGSKAAGNKIEASVDAKSISTGIGARDTHLKKEEYFDATTYPKIKLAASLFSKQAEGKYIGYFLLTIKNTTKSISIPFNFKETDGKGSFTASFTINRRDYGVGGSSWIMADDVTISIEVLVSKK